MGGGQGSTNLFVSTDNGDTFTSTTKSSNFADWELNGIVWARDRFVAVGTNNSVLTKKVGVSFDGITWTAATNDESVFDSGLNGIDYNGSLFVAVGAGTNKVGYSYDGFTWSAATSANSVLVNTAFAVNWNGSVWYVGAFDNTASKRWLIYSSNLVSWTVITDSALTVLGTAVRGIASKPTAFVTPTPTPSVTPTLTPTTSPTVTGIFLVSTVDFGGTQNFCGKTTDQAAQYTCGGTNPTWSGPFLFYGTTISVGTQFLPGYADSACFATNQNLPSVAGWTSGNTEYIIETNSNGIVTRYDSFIVCDF